MVFSYVQCAEMRGDSLCCWYW